MSAQAALAAPVLEGQEFERIRVLVHEATGIHLGETKQSMVAGRLGKRLKHLGLRDYGAYLSVIAEDAAERQTALDLLTTNETYFFREPRHYDFVRETVLPAHPRASPSAPGVPRPRAARRPTASPCSSRTGSRAATGGSWVRTSARRSSTWRAGPSTP